MTESPEAIVACLWSTFVPVFRLYAVDGFVLEKTK